ncbi:TPA: hypothetical protein I7730_01120 [Vibrio vulnificus]|uniref:Uncharacterized protein n=1 Tax=Vibrio vulnificus TaxID=672 RepID=A0A8H9K5C9_VIBVL|nr:hypothetical protein [Vibrio vulnificus]HAS8538400.1 hypothetical protein [Vibrio vulnificus]
MDGSNISLLQKDLVYLREMVGMQGFMTEFRQKRALSFFQWLDAHFDKDSKPDEMVTIEVDLDLIEEIVFALTLIAYKIVCESVGRITPQSLLEQIDSVKEYAEKFGEDPQKVHHGSVWDNIESVEQWKEQLSDRAIDAHSGFLDLLKTWETSRKFDEEFEPKLVLLFDEGDRSATYTDASQCCIDLVDMIELYREKEEFKFRGPNITKLDRKTPWFKTHEWDVVVMAMVCEQLTYSYCAFVKKVALRIGNPGLHESARDKHGRFWRSVYQYLWAALISPRLTTSED